MSFLLSQCHHKSRILFLLWHYLKSAHKPTSQQWAKFKTRTFLFYIQPKGPQTWKQRNYIYSYVLSIDSVSPWITHFVFHVALFGISQQAHKPAINKFWNKDVLILHPTQRPTNLKKIRNFETRTILFYIQSKDPHNLHEFSCNCIETKKIKFVGLWIGCRIRWSLFQNLFIAGLWVCGLIPNSSTCKKECVIQGDTKSIERI
jgi:hypothetical protein